jgi:hypothetical protein
LFGIRAHESGNLAPLLLVHQQHGITNNVDEKDMGDL